MPSTFSKRKIKLLFVLIIIASVVLCACISAPSDPVAVGQLCEPEETTCKRSVLILRESVGRNQFDYTIENLGSQSVTIDVVAVTPEIESVDLMTIVPDAIVARQIHPDIAPGETIGNRITPKLLGTRDAFRVFVLCNTSTTVAPCKLKMEYVFESVPVECFDDNDCSSGWLCNVPIGNCAECLNNDDCNSDQTCDALQGKCTPEDATPSCSVGSLPSSLSFFVFVFAIFIARRRFKQTLVFIPAFFIFSYSPEAYTVPPPKAAISAGGGVRYLLGELGEDAQRGIGINITQEIRWRYFGGAVLLGTSFYQTTQDPPPFSRGLGTYTVAIGPRLYFGVGQSEFSLGGDIRRVGFLSNSLVRVTGLENDFTAVAVGLGYRYRFEKIEVKFDTTLAPFFALPGSVLSFDLSIGFSSN